MIVCKTCRIPFEEGAQFCNTCGGFVDYVGVREGADSGPAGSAATTAADGPGPGNATPRADTAQMAIAASAATDAEKRALADAEAQEGQRAEALARASAAAAAEQAALAAAAAAESDTEAKARAEAEARAQAAAKAKAEAEADAAARAAEASRRAAAMVAKPVTTAAKPDPGPTKPVDPQPVVTATPTPTPDLAPGETACAQCGTGNPATRNFCRQCGAPLGQAAPVAVAATPKVRGPLMAKLKLPLVFGVIIGLVAGIYFLTKDDDPQGVALPDETVTTERRPGRTTVAEPEEVTEEVTVDATKAYVDTGIELEVGAHVVIVATGEAESGGGPSGPEGDPNPNYRGANVVDGGHNGLIAKIGARGDPFFVGPRLVFDAEEAGTLFL
ncbi:MAG TPA: hypothetical protein VF244_00550, partial [Acidimicrobiales bacterium]